MAKQMKKILIFIIISSFFVSCTDWLTVKPFDAMDQDEVFANERNTNAALNGLYLGLATNNLYAKEMTCGMLEIMAQHYLVPAQTSNEHTYYRLNKFEYTSQTAKDKLAGAFRAAYKSIADCNEFLAKTTENKNRYSEAKYNSYRGEALAIRTLLHFDMLRLFGPRGNELDRESVPYYNASTDTPQPILIANDLLDILIADIDEAIQHLRGDAIFSFDLEDEVDIDTEVDFSQSFRNLRMNYYAANALKARMCLYKGTADSKATAYAITSNLLNDKDPLDPTKTTNFSKCFRFMQTATYQVYPEELLFAIHNINRGAVNKSLFSPDQDNNVILGGGADFLSYLYGIGFGGSQGADYAPAGMDPGPRGKMWAYEPIRDMCLFGRYTVTSAHLYTPYLNEFQSMIRLGEVYLIAAETAPTIELKRSWLDKLRTGKGYDPGNADGLNDARLNGLISAEFEKETYGEGQYFFFAKRKNVTTLYDQYDSGVSMNRGKYVPPLPDIETYYRDDTALGAK